MKNFLSRTEADELCDSLVRPFCGEGGISRVDIDSFVKKALRCPVFYESFAEKDLDRQVPAVGPDRGAFSREAGTSGPGAACELRPFTKVRGGSGMDARGIINYYGMLRLLKALEGHGFTQKELKRIAAHLELEVERGLFLSQPKQAA